MLSSAKVELHEANTVRDRVANARLVVKLARFANTGEVVADFAMLVV